jgi:hypothetical protein
MTAAERREANRLRSERWRRRHGIMPRKPAQRPWLAEGCSRSTWYRRGNRVRDFVGPSDEVLSRASAFVAQLQAELAEAARCNQVAAAIIGELFEVTNENVS